MWNEPSKEKLSSIPGINETDNISIKDKLVHLHFFIGGCDWYVIEFDGDDLFFGFTILNQDHVNSEWGYFSLSELKQIQINRWIEVDCDCHWKVRKASEVKGIKVW